MDVLEGMRAFRAVAEAGSFAEAARSLPYGTAWASRLVSQLEEHLGTQLLVRTTRRLALTDAGRVYLDRCHRILDDLDDAERLVTDLQAAPRGRLRVSAPMSFGLLRISPLLPTFRARYPEVDLEIVLDDRFVDLLEEGVDLAVRVGERLEDSSLVARRLATGQRVLCAAPSYLEAHGVPEHPRELASHACLRYALHAAPSRWHLTGSEEPVAVEVRGPLVVNNSLVLRDAAIAGMGVLLAPDFIVEDALRAEALRRVLPDWTATGYGVFAVSPPARFSTPKVRAFVELLGGAWYGSTP